MAYFKLNNTLIKDGSLTGYVEKRSMVLALFYVVAIPPLY
jgi:hypothetical protein